jgi:hypothetical protein
MMALSESDKREIAAMFESFSERMSTGRKVVSAEEQALEILAKAIHPTIVGPRFVPLEERAVGAVIETVLVPSKRKKAISKFNKAVKEGMKMVKASNQYGKVGSITNGKKVFGMVAKTVSKARKGAKLPKKGVLRRIARYTKGLFK